jgi:DNA-binding MarR family transcriptional regulator
MAIGEDIQQRKFRNPHQKAAINLIYTSNWLEGRQKDFFKTYGITNQQFNILRILRGQHPSKISGAEIKSRMIDQNSDVSRLLDRLIAKKMIAKNQCPDDKRVANVMITDKGLQLLHKIDDKIDHLDGLLSKLTPDEANLLSNLLDKARG